MPELSGLISENPDYFDEDSQEEDGTTNLFIAFLLFEWQKGEQSFWKPWLDVMPEVQQFHDWR